MADREQLALLETFATARPSNPLFCHQDFLEKLAEHSHGSIGRRAAFLMQRLAVDAKRLHYKATYGVNRGWRRSRLGGNRGSHFYAWWAPKGAFPLKASGAFSGAPDGSLFLRDIRHHDDHSPLSPHSYDSHYLPVTVRDLRREEYSPAPWTQPQARFASARQPVRLLKGHPGSGKTTALWHAADSSGAERVLYVTYSRDLAALARDYFDRYCSSHKHFHVVTFPHLIRQLLGSSAPVEPESESRQRFLRDLYPFARTLGAWTNSQVALYDEFHAHLVGDALPVAIGRFAASVRPRVSDRSYRERRTRILGPQATTAGLETAARLERVDSSTLADRYFPELALAWKAAERLRAGAYGASQPGTELLDFDCIAVDESQDLTPIEAFVLVQLASCIRQRRVPVSLLMAGDEAQTVRPTDFEWGWLSDLLHSQVGTPSEHQLSSNLRSPRRIAELVNRVGDLYSRIEKQERPSGTGYAEIDDDATDQMLYCTAVPGPELDALLTALAAREGLALIAMGDTLPAFVPEPVRPAVMTVSQAKGLDFHSVCVIDAGRLIDRIVHEEARVRADSDIEGLRKRLAIDQLRVALSRASERLLWLDINPADKVVRQSVTFLNAGSIGGEISSCVPAAVLKTLEEDELDAEERVQRCQADARQYLEVKPEMAWSRAQQAVTLLGPPGSPAAVTDQAARDTAYLTLAEICFILGLRNTRLPPELGRPDLFGEAHSAAGNARRYGLAAIIRAVEHVHRASAENRLQALAELAHVLPSCRGETEPWLLLELGARSREWVEALEGALFSGQNAAVLIKLLPPFYEALGLADRTARIQRLQQRAIQLLIKDKQFAPALAALRAVPERQPKLEAVCHEGLGDFRSAADCHRAAGNLKEALNCYRSIPDLEAALTLLREMGEHPATQSLEWVARLQALVAERPERFTKVVTPAEKKLLEELLERSLGVKRRKPAPRTARRTPSVLQPILDKIYAQYNTKLQFPGVRVMDCELGKVYLRAKLQSVYLAPQGVDRFLIELHASAPPSTEVLFQVFTDDYTRHAAPAPEGFDGPPVASKGSVRRWFRKTVDRSREEEIVAAVGAAIKFGSTPKAG
jgi:tetratricopeptide (TPR) repeat protein